MTPSLFLDVPGFTLQNSIEYEVVVFTPLVNWEGNPTGTFDIGTYLAHSPEKVEELIRSWRSRNKSTGFVILLKESHRYSRNKTMYPEDFLGNN